MAGMLGPSGEVMASGIDQKRIQAAAARLRAAGMPVNRTNIAVMLSQMQAEEQKQMPKGAYQYGQRTPPKGSMEEKILNEWEMKRRQGPPPEMLRRHLRGQ